MKFLVCSAAAVVGLAIGASSSARANDELMVMQNNPASWVMSNGIWPMDTSDPKIPDMTSGPLEEEFRRIARSRHSLLDHIEAEYDVGCGPYVICCFKERKEWDPTDATHKRDRFSDNEVQSVEELPRDGLSWFNDNLQNSKSELVAFATTSRSQAKEAGMRTLVMADGVQVYPVLRRDTHSRHVMGQIGAWLLTQAAGYVKGKLETPHAPLPTGLAPVVKGFDILFEVSEANPPSLAESWHPAEWARRDSAYADWVNDVLGTYIDENLGSAVELYLSETPGQLGLRPHAAVAEATDPAREAEASQPERKDSFYSKDSLSVGDMKRRLTAEHFSTAVQVFGEEDIFRNWFARTPPEPLPAVLDEPLLEEVGRTG